ncbi:hypothetical protein FA95DRAFT_446489 [Auriscalpium vulgare]|uniref:Uncharacterized protein n=1 Tax=Auriscalpium vulgare TaxID=40419 RepID=A0ACB8RFX7_9AGAM|nr:hypothetical protein FA95DRAFT_446489 [Auriscalpium vulgare]
MSCGRLPLSSLRCILPSIAGQSYPSWHGAFTLYKIPPRTLMNPKPSRLQYYGRLVEYVVKCHISKVLQTYC